MIKANCHCGNIELSTEHSVESVTECNCSICYRYGVQWAYFSKSEVKVIAHKEKPVVYLWAGKNIEFVHCPICGCITHYQTVPNCEIDRFAINYRMVPDADEHNLPVHHFDGKHNY